MSGADMKAPFVHTPRAPEIVAEKRFSDQRYFCDEHQTRRDMILRTDAGSSSSAVVCVMRFATKDRATLTLGTRIGLNDASVTLQFTPTELREIAQRLLDAAHDIEAHPSAALLARERQEAVPA